MTSKPYDFPLEKEELKKEMRGILKRKLRG
jgi:hypothetical protein